MTRLRAVVAAIALLALPALWAQPAIGESMVITGSEEVVFDWTEMACDPEDVPDGVAHPFRDAENRVQLLRAGPNRRMIGPDLNSLVNDCTVLKQHGRDPLPWHFNQYSWLNSPNTSDGSVIHALVHTEYHGVDNPGWCPSGVFARCHYTNITAATSTDGGNFYFNTEPPTHRVAGIPYPYLPEVGRVGVFSPSNIIQKDNYYYAMVLVSATYKAQRPGVCLMRTQHLSDPSSWRAWDGAGFSLRFINPYLEPSADPRQHTCHPVSFEEISQVQRSLTYNSYLDKFVVIGTSGKIDPVNQQNIRGFYYSFSDDLIHWSDRQLLIETPLFVCGSTPLPKAYPSVVDHDSSDRNYNTADQTAYLYFTRFNLPNCREPPHDRDLMRVPIEFRK